MPQFFIDKKFTIDSEIEIRGGDARHISSVLRLGSGDWIVLSDGAGRSYRAKIVTSSPACVTALIGDKIQRREGLAPAVLALALIKLERFEWAIEKAVEIGCRRIIPFRSARTIPQFALNANARRLARWQKVALSAAKQSGLPFVPEIDSPHDFSNLFNAPNQFRRMIFFYEGEDKTDIRALWRTKPADGPDLIIIGPEGGFTNDEVALAKKSGAITASLGSQILRVETAAIAALAIWQYEEGNMDMKTRYAKI